MRVPTVNVSAIDLSVMLNADVDTAAVNAALAAAAMAHSMACWVIPKSLWPPATLTMIRAAA